MSETGDTTPAATCRAVDDGTLCSQCMAPGGNTPGPQHHVECMRRTDSVCPECGHGDDDCAHGRPPIRVSRNDERLIAWALDYYAAVRNDSIRNSLAVGEKIDAHHNVQAARERDRCIELARRFR